MNALIRITSDGRKVEVIDGVICLDGRFEAAELTPIAEHPNSRDILRAAPGTTHMAGRLALDASEAAAVQAALIAARREADMSPQAIAERMRIASAQRQFIAGVE